MEKLNKKGIIKNSIIALIFGILVPIFLIFFVEEVPYVPMEYFINPIMLLTNGIIFSIIYICYGIFKKGTLLKFFIGVAYIIVIIYFYIVGYTIFTLYLPMCAFAKFCVYLEIGTLEGYFAINISLFVIIALILKGLLLVRGLIKPTDIEKQKHKRIFKFKKG